MSKRKIIKIDQDKCNGCGLCLPNCPEGAIRIIAGKARLISDLFCDGLGACLGKCPQGAIQIEERQAGEYDEYKVMENILPQGPEVITAHLEHLKNHRELGYLAQAKAFLKEKKISLPSGKNRNAPGCPSGGCPGSRVVDLREPAAQDAEKEAVFVPAASRLRQWPVQLMLVPAGAPYLNNADLLICADCVAFAYADLHRGLLKDKIVLVGCPKLDDLEYYREKLTQIFKNNKINSLTCAHMEVPCCFGLIGLIKDALHGSGKEVPFKEVVISLKGERRDV